MDTATCRGALRCDYHDVRPGTRYVILSGEADLATADQLEHDLRLLLTSAGVTRLVLDLTALRHLDCAALSALLAVRETALAHGQRVTITAAAGTPARVLTLSGVGGLFGCPQPLHGDRREPTAPHNTAGRFRSLA
ncbi:STAS domain-containing protein [Micromonospora sp. C28SCA-DRY-2]|uniref:STAS domain-containing protein n=1 Tax=Micromonospora sp. C28SCA-DRY-2 TaxID=3059522 RepID=UPI0026765413|nr:STAS domain-containing protein [Micromonospora sp. C28SCA-DRY-2]MDO3701418.1 STAS domain-containing protein [Micromonospora sp. C28SCA-DRY-2]